MIPHSMTRDEVRDVDRRAIENFGMPGVVLMENAGRGTAELLQRLGIAGEVVICCGKGNNGGDGFVIARHLENAGHAVRVLLFCSLEELQGDAAINSGIIAKAGTPLDVLADFDAADAQQAEAVRCVLDKAEWIVDALLGTGTRGAVREPFAAVITFINASQRRVLAVDLPSGLDCDTGRPLGPCVRAEATATFVARKRGFDAPESREFTGAVHVIDIGVPRAMFR